MCSPKSRKVERAAAAGGLRARSTRMGAQRGCYHPHREATATPDVALPAPSSRTNRPHGALAPRPTSEIPRVPLFRTPGPPLPGRAAGCAAARLRRVHVGVLGRAAAVPARDRRADGGDRRLRGAAVQHDGQHRRLARQGPARAAVDAGGQPAAPAGRRAGGQHRAGRAAVDDQAAGALRQLPDAAALELPPVDARAEHALLPGRVRGAHRDQGDADGARRPRHVAHRQRAARVRRHLLRHAARGAGRLRPAPPRAVPRVARVLRVHARLVRAAPGARRQGAGRRALADDRPHHRRVHEHRDGQALLARAAGGRIRAQRDAGVPRHRAHADAPRHGLRDRQSRAEHGPHRRVGGRHAVAVDAGRRQRRRRRGRDGHGAAPERHLALGDVGNGGALRAHRHRAGRHHHAVASARGRRRAGRASPSSSRGARSASTT